jgi:hypothetical protein
MRLPWAYGDGLTRAQWNGASIDIDFGGAALDMEQQVPFAMGVRHHRAIHGVEADAAECAMEHGHSFTQTSSQGHSVDAIYHKYIRLRLRGKQPRVRCAKCAQTATARFHQAMPRRGAGNKETQGYRRSWPFRGGVM